MNAAFFEFPQLLMASLTLALSATLAWLVLSWIKPSSHRMHRIVWFAVLLNGVLLIRYSIELPLLSPDAAMSRTLLHIDSSSATPEDSATTTMDGNPGSSDAVSSAATGHEDSAGTSSQSVRNEATPAGGVASGLPSGTTAENSRRFDWIAILPGVWALGFAVTILIFALRYFLFVRMVAASRPASSAWVEHFCRVCANAGMARAIPLLTHDQIGPAIVLTPRGYRVVVPLEFWSRLKESQREAILDHELAHLRRGDIWKSMLVTAMAAAHWFNPLSWLAVRKFNDAAEWACDQAVGHRDSQLRTDFARALLSLSTSNDRLLIGVSGFGSSNLPSRIKRLFESQTRDSLVGRIALMVLLVSIVSLGWVNLRLVAAATPAPVVIPIQIQDDQVLDEEIMEFTDSLEKSSDKLTNVLVQTLKTPAGRIAVKNRISEIQQQMRNAAAKQAIPEFFTTQIDTQFEKQIAQEIDEAREDIAKLSVALATLRSRLVGVSDADKMLTRFLDHENAARVLYFAELRKGMRPNVELLMQQRLGRIFADNGTGKLVVREGAKAKLIDQLEKVDEVEAQMQFMKRELKDWSDEIVANDALHRRVKEGLASPTGPVFFLAQLLGEGGEIRQRSEQYFEFLENLFVDTPEGLVIRDDRIEDLKSAIAETDQLKLKAKNLREPIAEIAEMIDAESSEAARRAKQFLQTDIGVAFISMNVDFNFSSADAIVRRITDDVLDKSENGLAVREDRAEEVIAFSGEMLRQNRRLRRHTRILDPHLEKLEDPSLRQQFDSIEGKMLLIEKITAYVSRLGFDGWPKWLEQHFDDTPSGYAIRDEAREAIEGLINDAHLINEEMAKDDF